MAHTIELGLTDHAATRCRQRAITQEMLDKAIRYGSCRYLRGADHYIVGWREVAHWRSRGVDLSDVQDLRVVCAYADGAVITAYRQPRHERLGRRAQLAR